MTGATSHAGARVRGVGYLLMSAAGVGVIVWPSPAYDSLAWLSVIVGGVLLIVPGACAAGGVLWHRYQVEWAALPALIVGFTVYAALAWAGVTLEGNGKAVAGACALTGLVFLLVARFLQVSEADRVARLVAHARRGDPR